MDSMEVLLEFNIGYVRVVLKALRCKIMSPCVLSIKLCDGFPQMITALAVTRLMVTSITYQVSSLWLHIKTSFRPPRVTLRHKDWRSSEP